MALSGINDFIELLKILASNRPGSDRNKINTISYLTPFFVDAMVNCIRSATSDPRSSRKIKDQNVCLKPSHYCFLVRQWFTLLDKYGYCLSNPLWDRDLPSHPYLDMPLKHLSHAFDHESCPISGIFILMSRRTVVEKNLEVKWCHRLLINTSLLL